MVKTKGAKNIQWNDVRSDIQRMYVDEGFKLEDVRSRLKTRRNFDASIRSYRSKINEWGFKRRSTTQTGAQVDTSYPVSSHTTETGGPSTSTTSLSEGNSESSASEDLHTVMISPIGPVFVPGPNLSDPTPQSPLGAFPPAVPSQCSDEILLQAIDHIDQGRATKLREILVGNDALVNEIIPSMAAFRGLSRYHGLPGKSLLYCAASISTAEVVEVLLDAGADINKQTRTYPHHTPLMKAVARSATEIVKVLLEKGADTEITNGTGDKALTIAASYTGDPRIVEMLLQSKTPSLRDRHVAYADALSRREREYGTSDHKTSTRVMRVLATFEQTAHPSLNMAPCFDLFLEPWKERPNWACFINEDEKRSLMHLIGQGLDLHQSFAPPKVHSDATLAHALLFHCWEADMPKFLAQNLGNLPNRESVGGLLLRTLTAGCPYGSSQGNRNADAVSVLLEHGVNPESEDQFGSCALSLWVRSLNHCSTQAEIKNALPILAVLLHRGGVNPNRARSVEPWPIACLLEQEWTRMDSDTAVEVLVMLLAHFPDDMSTAPFWQLPRYDFPSYFPITRDFERYGLDNVNVDKFRKFTQGLLSADSSGLLLKAAYILSMRKYLAFQFAEDKDSRAYDKISFVVKELTEFGVPAVNIPTEFVLDTISHLALLKRQAPQPIDSTETPRPSFFQVINEGNPSSEHQKDDYSTWITRKNGISSYGEGRCSAAGTNTPNDVLAAESRFHHWNTPTYNSHITQPENKTLEVWPGAGLL